MVLIGQNSYTTLCNHAIGRPSDGKSCRVITSRYTYMRRMRDVSIKASTGCTSTWQVAVRIQGII